MKIKNVKTGEWVTWKEFIKQWKKGIEEVTPLQQCRINQMGFIISLVGLVWGIVFSVRIGYWWMGIILIGGLFIVLVQYLANWQKKQILLNIEKQMEVADGSK